MATDLEIGRALIRECKRRIFDESLPRIRKCLAELTPEEVWARPNEHSNSAGNLVLHLAGNVRQYVISALGGAADVRERPREFSETGPIPVSELLDRLEKTLAEAGAVIDRLDPATLLETRRVQGFVESGLSILVHVTEHLSYHTGQLAYLVKARKDLDLGFYRGKDLNRKG